MPKFQLINMNFAIKRGQRENIVLSVPSVSKISETNGRMYDPVIGRVLSPDNFVQDPNNAQNYNRYSYCLNNPLKYSDPTGMLVDWWRYNVDSGESSWVNDYGGNEQQIVQYTNNEGYHLGFHIIDGDKAYVTHLGNGKYITSNYDPAIPEGYNSITGYVYTKRDLEFRRNYSGSVFLRLIRENEANGLAEPIGLNDWIDFHGATYYNMYRLAAGTSLAFQFVGAPTGQSLPRTSGYNLKMSAGNITVKGETTVLGHCPAYTKLAGELGAKRFIIPTNVWNKMTPAQQWGANQKFLDRMILRGDNIRLATPLNQVKPGSFYQKELNYLFDKGYKVSSDGLWLVK